MNNKIIARVTNEHRGSYRVKNGFREYVAKITGKQIFEASSREDFPAVGDWVEIEVLDDAQALIQKILPRKSVLKKKYSDKEEEQIIAANIDAAFIVEAVDRDFSINRLERYLVLAEEAGIEPIIILNKIDLISVEELNDKISDIKSRFKEIKVITTSTTEEKGLADIEKTIEKAKTYCFLGSSGVGKSSIINKLLKKDAIKTSEISSYSNRGKHTTTNRQMYFLKDGGIVIDNPGTREVGLAASDTGIENVFSDIKSLSQNCKFADCSHINEPGCAVLDALNNNKLDPEKYSNFLKLKKESDYSTLTDLEKRHKDRKFGKFIKKALEQLKD